METVLRVAVIYLFLMTALRMMGKRDVGHLAPFGLIILLLIPELVSQGLVREDFSLTNAIIAVSTLLSLAFITSCITFMRSGVEKVVEGEHAILVQHGFLVPEAMSRDRIPPGEIFSQMHKSGIERISQVKWAILETDGTISFIQWEGGGSEGQQKDEMVV